MLATIFAPKPSRCGQSHGRIELVIFGLGVLWTRPRRKSTMAPTYSVLGFGGHTWVARSNPRVALESHSSFRPRCWPHAGVRVAVPRPRAQAPHRPRRPDDIAAEVPAAIKAAAPIQIATDASYAPNEFVDPNTGNLVGWDIELAKDVCKVLGVAVHDQQRHLLRHHPGASRDPVQVPDELLQLHADARPRGQGHRLHHLLPGG